MPDEPETPEEKRPDGEPAGLSQTARAMYRAEPYFQAAWSLVGGVAVGVIGGYFADRWLGTKPWLLVAGAVVGMAAGFYGFVKAISAAERSRKK